jgi:hypothetical protein
MRGRRIWPFVLLLALIGAAAWTSLTSAIGADYRIACPTCDSASPGINALAAGHFSQFFHVQPVMGGFSLFVRAPFAALVHGDLWRYRVGALVLLLIVALIAWWLAGELARRGKSHVMQLAVAGIMVASPLTFQAMHWGHPEEPLAAALCVAAVVLAGKRQATLAGVALGLALASKQWALLAVVPTVMLADGARWRLIRAAALSAAVFTLPLVLGDAQRYFQLATSYSGTSGHPWLTPSNIWWPLGIKMQVFASSNVVISMWRAPALLQGIVHPLVIGVVLVISVAYWRAGLRRDAASVLYLLSLSFLLRCMLDTLTYGYHHLPMLLTLTAAEGLRRRTLPSVALAVAAVTWLMNNVVAKSLDPDLVYRVYLAWSVPLFIYLLLTVFQLRVPAFRLARTARASQ